MTSLPSRPEERKMSCTHKEMLNHCERIVNCLIDSQCHFLEKFLMTIQDIGRNLCSYFLREMFLCFFHLTNQALERFSNLCEKYEKYQRLFLLTHFFCLLQTLLTQEREGDLLDNTSL
jgi:hypothetical protein